MNSKLYNTKLTCPVCSKEFDVTKVKAKSCKVSKRDSDFFTLYEDLNPMLYDVWVCENCGYASMSDKFESISVAESKIVYSNIATRWNSRKFSGERDLDNAIEAFKLALYNHQVRKSKSSEVAKVCLRIAWLYRLKEDSDNEKTFLDFALKAYNTAYSNERFPIDKLDENTCAYMIAELNRRLGNLDESIKWFSSVISSPDARKNASLIQNARDQFQLAKEQLEGQSS